MNTSAIRHLESGAILPRPLFAIARAIRADWKDKAGKPNINYAAKPYLDAMESLNSIDDKYIEDSGASVVAYFLANASSWRGEKAKAIKAELNAMLKRYYGK